MKKIIYILLLIVPLLTTAKPTLFKTGGRPKLQYGGQIGVNLNYFIYRNGLQKDVSFGYQGGLFLRVSRKKVFAQFEVNMLRSTVNITNGVFNNKFGRNITYDNLKFKYYTVGIPFILGGYAVKKPLYKLRFDSGIQAEFITKTNAKIEQNNREFYRLKRDEKRDILRPAQFSYLLGSGFDVAMFVFDIKYSVGMLSFFKDSYRTQTNLFQFNVGVIF